MIRESSLPARSRGSRSTESQITNHKAIHDSAGAEVGEPRLLAQEREPDDAGRAVALLGDDQFRGAGVGIVRIPVVDIVAIDQDDDVRVLLECAGFAQVGSCGRWSERDSGARDSCESTTMGTFNSFASPFNDREIEASSSVRFS